MSPRSALPPPLRVLVVAGTGFIGSEVARRLATRGHDVTVLHRGRQEAGFPAGIRNIRSRDAAVPIVAYPAGLLDPRPDVVIHMVLLGERDAAAAVAAFRGRTGRLVVISCGDVYAPSPLPLSEDSPLRETLYPHGKIADSPYGEVHGYDKLLVERTVRAADDLPTTILRLPKVYGPRDRQRTFLPWIARMDDRRPILIGESHARYRTTHGYIDNVAEAIALAATHPSTGNRVYNVGEPAPPTTVDRIRAIAQLAGWSNRLAVLPDARIPRHLGEQRAYTDLVYDTTRLRTDIAFNEPISPQEALTRTLTWERQNAPPALDHTRFDYESEDEALAGC